MYSKISKRFHRSDNSKGKLLNIIEFCKLEKKTRKEYFCGLFQKNQVAARNISKKFHENSTKGTSTSSNHSTGPSTSSIYSDVDSTPSPFPPFSISPLTQTESHSIVNDIIVSDEEEHDIISKQMKKKTSQDSLNELQSHAVFTTTVYAPVIIPTTPSANNNRKSFYMDTKNKEEDQSKLPTTEKFSSGEDCLARTERLWKELEDEGLLEGIPPYAKNRKSKLDPTRRHLEPRKTNRGKEIENMSRVSSRENSLNCENFKVELKSPTAAATITAPTPVTTTDTTPSTAIKYRKWASMQNEVKEEEEITSPRESLTSFRSNTYNISKSRMDTLRINRYKENKALFGWPERELSDNRDEIDFQSPAATVVTPEDEERIKLTDREKKSSRYEKYINTPMKEAASSTNDDDIQYIQTDALDRALLNYIRVSRRVHGAAYQGSTFRVIPAYSEFPTIHSQSENKRIFPPNPFSPCKRAHIKPVNHGEDYGKCYRSASGFADIKMWSPFYS